MYHLVASARQGHLLWVREPEAAVLFASLLRAFPETVALCVMPDHVHLVLPHDDPGRRLGAVMSGYTRWRNFARGRRVAGLWAPAPPPEHIPNAKHVSRTVRYVHLNPCRDNLVNDPLAWPFSTHRDRVGFARPGPVRVEADPHRFHHFVSGDPSVNPLGTPLPVMPYGEVTWGAVVDAVAGVCRVPAEAVASGLPRRLAVRCAAVFGLRDDLPRSGLSRTRLFENTRHLPHRGAQAADPLLEACLRAVDDGRFAPLSHRDQRQFPRWLRYRDRS